jgi:beta-glucanase (GH16 family)
VFFVSCLAAVVLSAMNPVPDASRPFEPWALMRAVPRGAAPPILASLPSASGSPSTTQSHAARSPEASPTVTAAASSAPPTTSQVTTTPPVTQQGGGPMPGAPPGFTTVFSDNFGGPAGSAPSSQNWFYDIGTGFGNNEVQQTTNSTRNTYLDGQGDLVLQANQSNGSWTSAQIETVRSDFGAPAGGKLVMTASIQQPNVANPLGYWPAFWALGAPMRSGGGWPQSGEIDMLEDINGLNTASQTFHYGNGSQLSPGMKSCQGASSCQGGFHTYSVVIDRTNTSAETLQFLLDGAVQATYSEAQVGTSAWQAAVDHGFFMILDLAMGGSWPDGQCNCTAPTSATTSGGTMRVGYVAVYEQGGN